MELIIFLFIMGSVGFLIGYKVNGFSKIDYKQRWKESLEVIKNEKLLTEELEEIKELPERYKGRAFIESYDKPFFKGLNGDQRKRMELYRLAQGLPPKDSMGGADPENWTEVRMAQLEAGWEHYEGGWYKVK